MAYIYVVFVNKTQTCGDSTVFIGDVVKLCTGGYDHVDRHRWFQDIIVCRSRKEWLYNTCITKLVYHNKYYDNYKYVTRLIRYW